MRGLITVQDLTLIVGTADPRALYDCYQDLSERFDHAGVQLDEMHAQLDRLTEDQADEREHLAAELDRLSIGQTVLLGWLSAYYAAYTFALRGTYSSWMDRESRAATKFVDAAGCTVRPLAPARRKAGGRR